MTDFKLDEKIIVTNNELAVKKGWRGKIVEIIYDVKAGNLCCINFEHPFEDGHSLPTTDNKCGYYIFERNLKSVAEDDFREYQMIITPQTEHYRCSICNNRLYACAGNLSRCQFCSPISIFRPIEEIGIKGEE